MAAIFNTFNSAGAIGSKTAIARAGARLRAHAAIISLDRVLPLAVAAIFSTLETASAIGAERAIARVGAGLGASVAVVANGVCRYIRAHTTILGFDSVIPLAVAAIFNTFNSAGAIGAKTAIARVGARLRAHAAIISLDRVLPLAVAAIFSTLETAGAIGTERAIAGVRAGDRSDSADVCDWRRGGEGDRA